MPANKPWDQKPGGRRLAETQERRRVLIVCEDSKSSRFYFESFPIDANRAEVRAVGTGMNTDSLVEEALRLKIEAVKNCNPYNEVWCVMDRDSFPLENYSRAFELARGRGIKVAWANEAFEFWYLLHFNYHDTGINRNDYKTKLKPYLEYEKNDKSIYRKVVPLQAGALRNAKRLERHWNDLEKRFPERENPSTNVHKLVEFLNELVELGST
ncbi:MAG TPA: RloB family protein [Verrucomicrobiae bacterium]|jgi:hypothetical protein